MVNWNCNSFSHDAIVLHLQLIQFVYPHYGELMCVLLHWSTSMNWWFGTHSLLPLYFSGYFKNPDYIDNAYSYFLLNTLLLLLQSWTTLVLNYIAFLISPKDWPIIISKFLCFNSAKQTSRHELTNGPSRGM